LKQGESTTFILLMGKGLTSINQKTNSTQMEVDNSLRKKRWNLFLDSRVALVGQVTLAVSRKNEEVWVIRPCLLLKSCLLIGLRFMVSRNSVPTDGNDQQVLLTPPLTQVTETSKALATRRTKVKKDFRSNYTREANHRQIR